MPSEEVETAETRGGRPPSILADLALYGYGSALIGAIAWVLVMLRVRPRPFEPGWAAGLLLLGPLTIVPLGLRLAARAGTMGGAAGLWRVAVRCQPVAALLLLVAFTRPVGWTAAALAVPWLLVTGLVALAGLIRVRQRGLTSPGALCIDAGLIYLAIGGGWTLLDRLGVRPLGFEPVIVLLTAVHFHYAGFILPILTGLAVLVVGGRLRGSRRGG